MRAIPHASYALALCVLAAGCTGDSRSAPGAATAIAPTTTGAAPLPAVDVIVLQLGADVPPAPRARIEALVRQAAVRPVEVRGAQDPIDDLGAGSLVLAIGETNTTRAMIPAGDMASLGPEGFVVRARDRGGVSIVAADGNPPASARNHLGVNRGLLYAAYAALEEVGFAFLHPLAPTLPAGLSFPGPVDLRESPYWPQRGWHLHTMHPLELTELLNGWGPGGPTDEAGWRAQLPEWERYCEWSTANRQNEVEWVLLMADSWQTFADGAERQGRLRELVDMGHAWGIEVGVDAALALRQQHAYLMVRQMGTLADEERQIDERVDYLLGAGFDFLATELGLSEFTAPDDRKMVAWLDAFTERVAGHHGKRAYAKVHVSQGQTAPHYLDPDTGLPLNFNFLPHYADPRLGVMPHTVQYYGLTDPAPTYGATDFAFMREFMQEEAGARTVLWHPETAYWVSYDVDVPLFLPVYADRRLSDLRLIAADEQAGLMGRGPHAGARVDGQMNFSSGWEWGYWLNDVVAARGVWDPQVSAPSDEAALRRALAPVVRPFGPVRDQVLGRLVDLISDQRALLIHGEVNGRRPPTVEQRNGQGYLQGHDTWDELMELASLVTNPSTTQPRKAHLGALRHWIGAPYYPSEIEPLLAEMATTFTAHADALEALAPQVPARARPLYDDVVDAARMTALRAQQVHGLYDFVHSRQSAPVWALARLAEARRALDDALLVVQRREPSYRVDPDRIAGWRDTPTAYEFTYLWSVRSLHYWWRDEGLAVDQPWSPAYLNVIDPLEVAFGEGFWSPLTQSVHQVGRSLGWTSVTDVLDAPAQEPVYPPQGLRSRP